MLHKVQTRIDVNPLNIALRKGHVADDPSEGRGGSRAHRPGTRKDVRSTRIPYETERRHYRAVWISDLHLGTRGCNAGELLRFLRAVDCDTLYLVGDIVDGWRLRRTWYWPQAHNDIVQKILRKARKGTRVIYVPGNHDEFLMNYLGDNFGGIEIVQNCIHESASGKRFLVLHGHEFDNVVRYSRWLAFVGDYAYACAQTINHLFNVCRRTFGMGYWSLSTYLKHKVKNAVNFISSFENVVCQSAAEHDVDGVICGHIHHAQIRDIGGVTYCNDGDWVESCTALVEDHAGDFHLIRWFSDHHFPSDRLDEENEILRGMEKREAAFGDLEPVA